MQERAFENPKIDFVWDSVIEEVVGNGKVAGARIRDLKSNEITERAVDGVFVAIGHQPNSHLVADQVDTDENGYVLVEGRSTKTNRTGVFAAGDLTDHTYRQAVTAAGTGCMAALEAEKWLAHMPEDAPAPAAYD